MADQMNQVNSFIPRGLSIQWPKIEFDNDYKEGVFTGKTEQQNFIGRGDLCNVFG